MQVLEAAPAPVLPTPASSPMIHNKAGSPPHHPSIQPSKPEGAEKDGLPVAASTIQGGLGAKQSQVPVSVAEKRPPSEEEPEGMDLEEPSQKPKEGKKLRFSGLLTDEHQQGPLLRKEPSLFEGSQTVSGKSVELRAAAVEDVNGEVKQAKSVLPTESCNVEESCERLKANLDRYKEKLSDLEVHLANLQRQLIYFQTRMGPGEEGITENS